MERKGTCWRRYKAEEIIKDFEACYEDRPWLAMVNLDKGITNLVKSPRQGNPVDFAGCYMFDFEKASKSMNPSPTLNGIIGS